MTLKIKIACVFCVSVLQTTLSSPGVLDPELLTTRLTAMLLAANEHVRSRCKDLTLPRRPSRSALAIRT